MTSSLRNSIHRRNHKERSQLAHRAKLGILEKHSDYVKRARDYHSKQDRLTRLKQKAAERNKDEFYFSMVHERTKGGVHVKDRGNVALPTDIVKVLKSQDENYVRTMRSANSKKMSKIKLQLTNLVDLLGADSSGAGELADEDLDTLVKAGIVQPDQQQQQKSSRKASHIVFVQDKSEEAIIRTQKSSTSDASSRSDSPRTANTKELGWVSKTKSNQRIAEHLEGEETGDDDLQVEEQSATSSKLRLIKELAARLKRDQQLRYAQREFELQRFMMGKGARQKISGPVMVKDNNDDDEDEDELDARRGKRRPANKKDDATYKPRVYKWRLERKR